MRAWDKVDIPQRGAAPSHPPSPAYGSPSPVGSKGEWGGGVPQSEEWEVSLSSLSVWMVAQGLVLCHLGRGWGRDSQRRPQTLACA